MYTDTNTPTSIYLYCGAIDDQVTQAAARVEEASVSGVGTVVQLSRGGRLTAVAAAWRGRAGSLCIYNTRVLSAPSAGKR